MRSNRAQRPANCCSLREAENVTALLTTFDALVARQAAALAAPGIWFTGEEQVAIARQARAARAGRPGAADLPDAVADASRRIATEAWTIRPDDIAAWADAGLRAEAYVEVLSIVARWTALDTAAFGLALDDPVLPIPLDGLPSRAVVPDAAIDQGWVPTVGTAHPLTALTAIPGGLELQFDVHDTLYLSIDDMGDPLAVRDGATRAQIELAAARTSYLNECFF